ncbi:unnamed protein product [Rhodiola kirilowii]
MVSAAMFTSIRRRRSPSLEACLAPVDLGEDGLVRTLEMLSTDLLSCGSSKSLLFQRKNSRSLIRQIEVFGFLLEDLRDFERNWPGSARLCLKELHLLLYRSKILLDYCAQSSKLWLLLQNQSLSSYFRDLNQEILTLLDVFPLSEIELCDDLKEQLRLVKKQVRRRELFIDERDEMLRLRFYSFLDELHKGKVPDRNELKNFFVDDLGIKDVKSCRSEIEFLEEQIYHHEGEMEPTSSVLNGFVALVRYTRFLLFGFEEDDMQVQSKLGKHKKGKVELMSKEIVDTYLTVPKDFCCPISLDLMEDPVIICTGQSYDRAYITRWMEDGHCTCPKTGQMLSHARVVPNQALRNLIIQWCTAHGVAFECPETAGNSVDTFAHALPTKAAIEANKATTALLIHQLACGTQGAQSLAALEIRQLAKTGKENRAIIAEAGAIHYLRKLLRSSDMVAQENAVTAVLNLSIYEKNKTRVMDEEGCLESIVDVLRFGLTTEARENAAATLFSLSAVHDYKKKIAYERGAIEALTMLLKEGTLRGKKDAVTALFNLSTHSENCSRMIEVGGVKALVGALVVNGVAEEAAGALALIVRQQIGAQAVAQEESAVTGLTGMMRSGSARGKENAVVVLLELCRRGGAAAIQRVVVTIPDIANLLESLIYTGTKRAKRKAASLARVFLKSENAGMNFAGLGIGYAISHNAGASSVSTYTQSVANRDSTYTHSAANRVPTYTSAVNMSISISLPVL